MGSAGPRLELAVLSPRGPTIATCTTVWSAAAGEFVSNETLGLALTFWSSFEIPTVACFSSPSSFARAARAPLSEPIVYVALLPSGGASPLDTVWSRAAEGEANVDFACGCNLLGLRRSTTAPPPPLPLPPAEASVALRRAARSRCCSRFRFASSVRRLCSSSATAAITRSARRLAAADSILEANFSVFSRSRLNLRPPRKKPHKLDIATIEYIAFQSVAFASAGSVVSGPSRASRPPVLAALPEMAERRAMKATVISVSSGQPRKHERMNPPANIHGPVGWTLTDAQSTSNSQPHHPSTRIVAHAAATLSESLSEACVNIGAV
mmetsp:Transcript_86481/g.244340  ORF Transcript_86481/g.244340 Transcript_86481/m.244340 type:complete len:324 (+) Transcript_86481:968-1939(+)